MKPDKKISAFSMFKKKKTEDVEGNPVQVQNIPKFSNGRVEKFRSSKKIKRRRSSGEQIQLRKVPKTNGQETDLLPITQKGKSPKFKKQAKSSMKAARSMIHLTKSAERVRRMSAPQPVPVNGVKKAKNKDMVCIEDSQVAAEHRFAWLIHPVDQEHFFKDVWEKKPVLLKRHNENYYKNLFTCEHLDRILREKVLYFTENIDITSYVNGKRETHNPGGRAIASVVWDWYQKGCSVRLLNPQTYSRPVWKLCSTLQEFFSSFVGANVYLTPAGTQGFAPHYDDIEAFVLQLEGKKIWKLYSPRNASEELPRFSSENFSAADIGEPIITAELVPGDLLYFPRGIIHQASTTDDEHSLHITISTCQKNTWGDLLEKMIPQALQIALEENVEYRQSLPRDYFHTMGIANSDQETPQRDAFLKTVKHLVEKLLQFCPVDAAVDQMAKGFIHDSLPPVLTEDEKNRCVIGNGERWEGGKVVDATELDPDTEIKLIRKSCVRLVMEEESVRLYYTTDNSRVYREKDPQFVEMGAERAPAIEYLIHQYPQYVKIDDIPLSDETQKMELASLLYEKGLLLTNEPLEPVYDE